MKPSALPPRTRRVRRSGRSKLGWVLLGVSLIIVGFVGGILPIVPGTPIVLLGVGMMATHSPRGRLLRWRVGGFLRARGLGHLSSPKRVLAHLKARHRGDGALAPHRSPVDAGPHPGA